MVKTSFGVIVKSRSISDKLLDKLNFLAVDEFNAIHNYMTHSVLCGGWGFAALEAKFQKESEEELGHSKILMNRIALFEEKPLLKGFPDVPQMGSVKEIIDHQIKLEEGAVSNYNAAVKIAREDGDNGTREILEKILVDEEHHYDWLKGQKDIIDRVGIERYMALQVEAD